MAGVRRLVVRDSDTRSHRRAFTRKKLVYSVGSTDGGAHISEELDLSYARLNRAPGFIGISIKVGDDQTEHHAGDPLPALIRQVTWETVRTLERFAPGYL